MKKRSKPKPRSLEAHALEAGQFNHRGKHTMTNTQHTPGPWGYTRPKNVATFGHNFKIVTGSGDIGAAYKEEDARLIAQAPAMLDALRWVSDFLAVKLDEGQACILEDEVNAILSQIDGDVAPEV
jgi:hypothetical protein